MARVNSYVTTAAVLSGLGWRWLVGVVFVCLGLGCVYTFSKCILLLCSTLTFFVCPQLFLCFIGFDQEQRLTVYLWEFALPT